jgi:hypothetical protein
VGETLHGIRNIFSGSARVEEAKAVKYISCGRFRRQICGVRVNQGIHTEKERHRVAKWTFDAFWTKSSYTAAIALHHAAMMCLNVAFGNACNQRRPPVGYFPVSPPAVKDRYNSLGGRWKKKKKKNRRWQQQQ